MKNEITNHLLNSSREHSRSFQEENTQSNLIERKMAGAKLLKESSQGRELLSNRSGILLLSRASNINE